MSLHVLVNAINDNAEPRGPDRYLDAVLTHMRALPDAPRVTLAHAPWQRLFRDRGDAFAALALTPPRNPVRRLIWQALVFPRIANRIGADVVFLPNLLWTPGLRAPAVLTVHDLLQFRFPEKFGGVKARLLRPVIRAALARAARILSVSAFTTADLARFTGQIPPKVVTVTEGGPALCPRRGPEGRFFLYAGKIERSKNVGMLIRAFLSSDVLRAGGWRLVIAGPDGNASADIAPLLGDPRVRRTGFVTEAALEDLYLTTRAFVFPSVAEGFGLVMLEAMARGAPVIAMRATALPEVVGDAGILIDPDPGHDPQAALRRAMERLATDDAEAARLRALGHARLAAFSWDRAARATLDILAGAAAEGRQ